MPMLFKCFTPPCQFERALLALQSLRSGYASTGGLVSKRVIAAFEATVLRFIPP